MKNLEIQNLQKVMWMKPNVAKRQQSKSLSKSSNIVKSDNSFQAKLPMDKALDSSLRWSREIDCHSILILDNCDDLIYSETLRERFIHHLKAMIESSDENLHIIFTSQQQLADFESL